MWRLPGRQRGPKPRRRGGRREVLIPDFVIGANATYYAGRLLTTNPRDFFNAFPTLEILTPQEICGVRVEGPSRVLKLSDLMQG